MLYSIATVQRTVNTRRRPEGTGRGVTPSLGPPPPLLYSSRHTSRPAIQKVRNNEAFIISIARIEMDWIIHWQSLAKIEMGWKIQSLAKIEMGWRIKSLAKLKTGWRWNLNLYWIPAAWNNLTGFQYLWNLCWIPAAGNKYTGFQYLRNHYSQLYSQKSKRVGD